MVVYTAKPPRLKRQRLAIRRVTRVFTDLPHAHRPQPLVNGVPLVRVRPDCGVLRLIILKIAEVGVNIIPWASLARKLRYRSVSCGVYIMEAKLSIYGLQEGETLVTSFLEIPS